jgi:hypothetical protein
VRTWLESNERIFNGKAVAFPSEQVREFPLLSADVARVNLCLLAVTVGQTATGQTDKETPLSLLVAR